MMKTIKILMVALFLAPAISLEAQEPIGFDLGFIKLQMPFKEVQSAYLYDLKLDRSLIGVETPVIVSKSGKNRLLVGAGFEEGDESLGWYIAGDTQVSDKYFQERFTIGAWIGKDDESDIQESWYEKVRGGLKASIKLW